MRTHATIGLVEASLTSAVTRPPARRWVVEDFRSRCVGLGHTGSGTMDRFIIVAGLIVSAIWLVVLALLAITSRF